MAKEAPPVAPAAPSVPPVPTAEDMKAIRAVKDEDLPHWVPPAPSGDNRYLRKMKENPFVPIGCLATIAALSFGLLQFKRGNTKRSQLAMRMRVLAQGGTVIALVVGVLWTSGRKEKD